MFKFALLAKITHCLLQLKLLQHGLNWPKFNISYLQRYYQAPKTGQGIFVPEESLLALWRIKEHYKVTLILKDPKAYKEI